MAIFSEVDRTPIDEVAELWRDRSLLGDASFTRPDEAPDCWGLDNVTDLFNRFLGNPLEGGEGGGQFDTKWQIQLEGASPEVRLLAGECLLVYYLITATVGEARKIEMVNSSIGTDTTWHLPNDGPFRRALRSYIANPGLRYNTRQDLQVAYLLDFIHRLKELPLTDRKQLLIGNPWDLSQFADDTEVSPDAMRHVICHLIHPREFERITSAAHKQMILESFGSLAPASSDVEDVDERLYQVRQALETRIPGPEGHRDYYYNATLASIWRPPSGGVGDVSPLSALRHKKQIIYFGPPGTGKTYQARQLAEQLVRTSALKRWGVDAYFQHKDLVETATREHITHLQLHPGFGYAEFMVGLQLSEGGRSNYRLGALPQLIERMQQTPNGLPSLPHVLILDEINRTDLSAMFGEAFTALEADKRDQPIHLAAFGDNGHHLSVAIPSDLHIIGTMNEIDQSVETLDFALRRRFFWIAAPFDTEALGQIWASQWQREKPRVTLEQAEPQLDALAANIERLNKAIAESAELGPTYQLGHAFFGDLAYFVARAWPGRRPAGNRILWDRRGKPQAPLTALWAHSIGPLLAQYLAASDLQQDQLTQMQDYLFTPPV